MRISTRVGTDTLTQQPVMRTVGYLDSAWDRAGFWKAVNDGGSRVMCAAVVRSAVNPQGPPLGSYVVRL